MSGRGCQGPFNRPSHAHKTRDRTRIIRNIREQRFQTVTIHRGCVTQNRVKGAFSRTQGLSRCSSRGRGNVNNAGKGFLSPVSTLRPRVRVGSNLANVLRAHPGANSQVEGNRHQHFRTDHQLRVVSQRIERCIDAAFDGVLNRYNCPVCPPLTHGLHRQRRRG